MARHSTEPQHHATVLERVVRIPEPRPDGSDRRPHGVAHHLTQPAGIRGFDVVIHEREQFAFVPVARRLIRRLKLNSPSTRNTRATFRFGAPKSKGRVRPRTVIDNHDLERPIIGLFAQASRQRSRN